MLKPVEGVGVFFLTIGGWIMGYSQGMANANTIWRSELPFVEGMPYYIYENEN